jgi:hypothetical protein
VQDSIKWASGTGSHGRFGKKGSGRNKFSGSYVNGLVKNGRAEGQKRRLGEGIIKNEAVKEKRCLR